VVPTGLHTDGDNEGDKEWHRRSADRIRRPRAHQARAPCPRCGTTDARLEIRGNQATVRCAICARHLYNAPKTETGEAPRTVRTLRRSIRPAQQARILNRDRGRCVLCGVTEDLTIGHLLSIEDGLALGATFDELNSDANLAAMCEACNLGLRHGPRSITPRTFMVLIWRLVQAERFRLTHPEQGQLPLDLSDSRRGSDRSGDS
jgi:hypothetical protein